MAFRIGKDCQKWRFCSAIKWFLAVSRAGVYWFLKTVSGNTRWRSEAILIENALVVMNAFVGNECRRAGYSSVRPPVCI